MLIQTTSTDVLFTQQTLERFRYFLNYNVRLYIDLYNFLIKNNKQLIINFYQKSDTSTDYQSFTFLEKMLKESYKIQQLIRSKKNNFNKLDDWELLDYLEDVKTKLETLQNAAKWTRSTKTNANWRSQSIGYDYTLKQRQTLEALTSEIKSGSDNQNEWINIALQNDLRESDYTVEGGNLLQVTKKITSTISNVNCESIVDTLIGENLYGLDFDKKLTFEDDDVRVLSHKDTFIQTILIHITLKKGDVPEFQNFGVDADLAVGSTVGKFLHYSLIRQLEQVFASDDSMRNFSVSNISYQNGDIFINYNVDSLYNISVSNTSQI